MEKSRNYWRTKSLHLLFTLQALFLATSFWDFFLTVIVKSTRSEVLTFIVSGMSGIILIPWVVITIVLSLFLFRVLMRDPGDMKLMKSVHVGYILMALIYVTLMVLAIINPVISWTIVLNYFVNAAWAIAITVFRFSILHAIEGDVVATK